MKRIFALSICAGLLLCACVQPPTRPSLEDTTPTWQEQYDLGVRYLSEGNYEEAIIAFTAAIEIDPKRAEAYVGRGGAYVLSGETEENLTAAKADYETAIELDETNAEAYLGLADVYIRQGDYDKALEILRQGLEKTGGSQEIEDKIAEIEGGNISDSSGKTRRSSHFENGELIEYWLYDYDERGNNVKTVCYMADGTLRDVEESEFDNQGQKIRMSRTSDGKTEVWEYEYDSQGREIKEISVTLGSYNLTSYSDDGRTKTSEDYDANGAPVSRFVTSYNEAGLQTRGDHYRYEADGTWELSYYVIYIWNEDGTYGGYELYNVS